MLQIINIMGNASLSNREQKHRGYFYKRATFAFVLVFFVLAIGTIGFHYIEGYSYVDAFYFVSMLATAEGPAIIPATSLGKIFASAIAFVSVGSVVFALAFLLGPFFARLLKKEEKRIEQEEKALSKSIKRYEKRI